VTAASGVPGLGFHEHAVMKSAAAAQAISRELLIQGS
jgi:hypothetical protein